MDLASLRKLVRWESLPPPPQGGGARPSRRGVFAVLFSAESLPEDPAPALRARRPGPGALFAREQLPLDPPGPPRGRRSHWLRWLFTAEKLDP
jgi:hypothetical protein